MQEYCRISSLSDAEVQYLDKQKIQDFVGGSINEDSEIYIYAANTALQKGHIPFVPPMLQVLSHLLQLRFGGVQKAWCYKRFYSCRMEAASL